ncbi:hypothetical protein C4K06_2341 [Pseudomonas chlororaphis subsp. aureofaciens]|uniref:Uncharacterized protein n=1 Tax=Pseudomonas chlororaphis subsp. aureofaciens TaxID=587851 RepID=A0AAD1E5H1_9PSED|nr:hypothetical protein C4K07_2287 [Pseudomonas chlororaphis subsp. aureofaciens]AZE35374.1 hypothetical protein C4K06_2341 [Pseudomonas chlororaphis subsp. aureofaciens]
MKALRALSQPRGLGSGYRRRGIRLCVAAAAGCDRPEGAQQSQDR